MSRPNAEPAATVTVYPDGPLVLRGDFEVRGLDGEPIDAGHTVALCRCGKSAAKPLCDGNHALGASTCSRQRRRRRGA